MDILLVADGRSPITHRYIQNLQACGYSLGLVSTFPCEPLPGLEDMHIIPVAFSQWSAPLRARQPTASSRTVPPTSLQRLIKQYRSLLQAGRYYLGPLSVHYYARQMQHIASVWKPTLVHALRIPFEGMLASFSPPDIPMVVSIWGNDLTLHAHGSAWMGALTLHCLQHASGLVADAYRDLRLGRQWGFDPAKPGMVVPGSGGIDLEEIKVMPARSDFIEALRLPPGTSLVINPRGFRPGSVRNDTFFQSIPQVLAKHPETIFLCPAMAGQPEAQHWVESLGISEAVRLLPRLSHPELWSTFKQAHTFVSVSAHDGTPNSLLEGMACGCFPIAGDIESLREWITPGVNGLLVEPGSPDELAQAILLALDSPALRQQAVKINAGILAQRADAGMVRSQIQDFYRIFGLKKV